MYSMQKILLYFFQTYFFTIFPKVHVSFNIRKKKYSNYTSNPIPAITPMILFVKNIVSSRVDSAALLPQLNLYTPSRQWGTRRRLEEYYFLQNHTKRIMLKTDQSTVWCANIMYNVSTMKLRSLCKTYPKILDTPTHISVRCVSDYTAGFYPGIWFVRCSDSPDLSILSPCKHKSTNPSTLFFFIVNAILMQMFHQMDKFLYFSK